MPAPLPPHPSPADRPARRAAFGRLALLLFTAAAVTQAVGCHNLQEHRRARWNYGPGMNNGSDPYAGTADASAFDHLA